MNHRELVGKRAAITYRTVPLFIGVRKIRMHFSSGEITLRTLNYSSFVRIEPFAVMHLCNARRIHSQPTKVSPIVASPRFRIEMSLVTHCIWCWLFCRVCHRIALKKATKRMDWTHVIFVCWNDASSGDMRQFYLIPFGKIKSTRCLGTWDSSIDLLTNTYFNSEKTSGFKVELKVGCRST